MTIRAYRHLPPAALVLLGVACATPQTRPPPVSPEAIAAEEAIQRRLVLEELDVSQQRLEDIGFRLLAAATPLCSERTAMRIGARYGTAGNYENEYIEAVAPRFALTDTLTILGVAEEAPASRAGLAVGDRILRVNGRSLPTGESATAAFADAIATARPGESIELALVRDGSVRVIRTTPVAVCDYDLVVTAGGDINAYADGDRVIVPWAMMRFANDDELASIVGHEIAHNAMGHADATLQNILLGGLLGLALDVAADEGDESDESATVDFMQAAAEAYSQEFELEADYVGTYLLARAGYPLDDVPHIWRKLATISPEAISYSVSHPTTAERFVRLNQFIDEIRGKISRGEALLPELDGR